MAAYILVLRRALRRERIFRDRNNPLDFLSDEELFRNYRFSRRGILHLVDLFGAPLRRRSRRNHALHPVQQLLIALRFYGTGTAHHVFAELFGVEKSTVSVVITTVTEVIASRVNQYIKFPRSEEEFRTVKQAFHNISRFPGVIGVVDCTHVRLFKAPLKDAEAGYVNRKGWHSINVQLMCDAEYRITNVVARWPGSAQDNFSFTTSNIGRQMERNGGAEGHLLGDSGYYQRTWMMTPFRQCVNDKQIAYIQQVN